ncbi:hypothetical protein P43SY_001745 [Pythium insidiosum]|uniref:Cystathionine gamma-synthase n=1 Tax=Pythium insidiosum TaxID=114742 RepID=A0AAD5Q8E5_PYTIN|nr:hypothetical protein P43SY_001745 [Pythium insidiosum]
MPPTVDMETEAAARLLAQQPLPLGVSLPPGDTHALSVSMPAWEDVVGYEEGRPHVLAALAAGYPRFFRHPLVRRLEAHLRETLPAFRQLPGEDWGLMALPTEAAAQRLVAFLARSPDGAGDGDDDGATADARARVTRLEGPDGLVAVVAFPAALAKAATRFWQHAGEIVSSRHAELLLRALEHGDAGAALQLQELRDSAAHTALRSRVAELYRDDAVAVDASDVFLYPTGMSAIFAALRLLTSLEPRRKAKAVLFGFPYLDTLKMLQRAQWCPGGVHFFPVGDDRAMEQLEELLRTEPVLGIFTECPGNPLLSLPDLERLSALARAHDTFLIVDDTIGSYNLNCLQRATADVVLTSLAKIFSGTCNVMAGSLVLNPSGRCYAAFKRHLASTRDAFLLEADARALLDASQHVLQRVARVNASASLIVERLQAHPLVKSLFYPSLDAARGRFDRLRSQRAGPSAAGYGPLLSVVLRGGERVARAFYDSLHVAKGPSLGTNFTLACPYTIIAHYYELDFVESCGVDRHLVRVSIGLEDAETLWQLLARALAEAQRVHDAAAAN